MGDTVTVSVDPRPADAVAAPRLTPRQRQVVTLLAEGLSTIEIGARLGISQRTARAHCDALRQKLGVERQRQIPLAYRRLTGFDPLADQGP